MGVLLRTDKGRQMDGTLGGKRLSLPVKSHASDLADSCGSVCGWSRDGIYCREELGAELGTTDRNGVFRQNLWKPQNMCTEQSGRHIPEGAKQPLQKVCAQKCML